MESEINKLENELKKSYKDFFLFAINLVNSINAENSNLKFAVVNMQIALELFLKYYFLRKGKTEWLFSHMEKLKFKDFSEILDRFYSKDSDILVTKKSHLKKILEARNKIVHSGKDAWDEELAINLINTALFIQNVLIREFDETLIDSSNAPSISISKNQIWRKGTESFASNLGKLNNKKVYECWFCYSRSFMDKKIFTYDENDDDGFQCVTCLNSLTLDYQIGIAECICGDNSFVLDCLNPQKEGEYIGRCLNCDISYHAYRCDKCEKYFLDFDNKRIIDGNKVFCSNECKNENKNSR